MQMSLFVLAVVPFHPDERPARYLVVQERDGTFYLPAGRFEPGENLIAAIVRETIEEAQQLVGVLGLLGFDHEPGRMRFVWACYRAVASAPKSVADRHSRGAAYLTRDEIAGRPLRHPEVLDLLDAFESGRALLPTASYAPRP